MTDRFDISGCVALVTGASSGLGEHFATVLAEAGAAVVLGARRLDRLEALAGRINDAGGRAMAVTMDVTELDSIDAALESAQGEFGTPTIIVNNSGVATTERAVDITEESFDHVVDTNLKGAWFVAQKSANRMIAAGVEGTIINVQSILSFRVASGVLSYAASKGGLLQITKSCAIEWARHGIRVNGISPGYIETDINREFFTSEAGERMIAKIPQRRIGQPGDLDGALMLLASDASKFMTGSTIVVDGGHLTNSL